MAFAPKVPLPKFDPRFMPKDHAPIENWQDSYKHENKLEKGKKFLEEAAKEILQTILKEFLKGSIHSVTLFVHFDPSIKVTHHEVKDHQNCIFKEPPVWRLHNNVYVVAVKAEVNHDAHAKIELTTSIGKFQFHVKNPAAKWIKQFNIFTRHKNNKNLLDCYYKGSKVFNIKEGQNF
eukprot:311738_1